MIPFRRILFPVDFSEPCRRAAPYVQAAVSHFKAELTLMYAFELPPYYAGDVGTGLTLNPAIPIEDIRTVLETRIQNFAADVIPVKGIRTEIVEQAPDKAIHEMVQREGFDLVMMPTRGHGAFRRMLLGSVTGKVLHDVGCAVWTSAHLESGGRPAAEMPKSILCAVDLDDEATSVLQAADALAKSYSASLAVVHSVQMPRDPFDLDLSSYMRQLLDRAQREMQALSQGAAPGAKVVVVQGPAAEAVRTHALAEKADLVVTGRGHADAAMPSFRSGLPVIIRESPCPVLSI